MMLLSLMKYSTNYL